MFAFLLFILSIVSSTYIDVISKCSCEQLLVESDCDVINSCFWDEKKCINIEDCQFDSPVFCPEDIKCAYLEGKCTKFTSCDLYLGDKSLCEAISIQCTSIDGKKCQKKQIPSCSLYDESICNDSYGFEGECGFFESKCQVIKQCSDIDLIKEEFQFMKCSIQNSHSCQITSSQKCVQKKCQDLPDKSRCKSVYEYDTFDNPQKVQLCKWEDGVCDDALPKDLDEFTCFTNTKFSYQWNPEIKSCQKCDQPQPDPPSPNNFGFIMKVAIMIYLISY